MSSELDDDLERFSKSQDGAGKGGRGPWRSGRGAGGRTRSISLVTDFSLGFVSFDPMFQSTPAIGRNNTEEVTPIPWLIIP